MRSLVIAFLFGSALAIGACSSNNGHKPDASSDGVTYDLSLDLPPGCPPGAANEKGVGAPCTRKGGECASPLVCACDTIDGLTLNGVPCMCTIAELNQHPSNPDPCAGNGTNCGSGATCCNYQNLAAYCSPNICLPGGQCIDFGNGGG
jgi:hypothetical protein